MAGIGLVAAVGCLGWLAGILGGDLSWGLMAAFLVLAWLHEFLLPTRFRVDEQGVTARGGLFTRRLAWRDATRLVIDEQGAWLGRARGSRWRRRGITMYWSPETSPAEAVLALAASVAPMVERRDRRSRRREGVDTVPSLERRLGDPGPDPRSVGDVDPVR